MTVAGLPITVAEDGLPARFCQELRQRNAAGHVHLINAYSVALASRDPNLFNTFLASAMLLPDGKPLALFARMKDRRARQMRGPDFFELVFRHGSAIGVRHFLLGSTPETLEKLQLALKERYPQALIVGASSPPFRRLTPTERHKQSESIRSSDPDVVWVGLGTPKQDFEAAQLVRETGITAVAVGAAFDFSAGTKPLAPLWMSHVGLEWLFRLISEPRRLWRRYLVGNIQFLCAVVRNRQNPRERR